jgi:uncharacterized membrane protein
VTERALRIAAAALALAGAAITAYLLYVRHTGTTLACTNGGCETVQHSRYAELLGIPVAALGLAGYLTILASAVARGELARTVEATVALATLVFGLYLLYVQVHLIGAICEWCVATDVLTTALAALALLRLRAAARVTPAS